MNKKIIGVIISVFMVGLVIVQLEQVRAQLADEPITGPITSPITSSPTPLTTVSLTPTVSPSVTPTITPTPTLIETASSTPTPTETPSVTPSETPTLIPSETPTETPTVTLTPTPTSTPGMKLGGLDLDSYCTNTNNPGLVLANGVWYCSNGAMSIDLTAACKWQYNTNDVVVNQDIPNNPWSWTCYVTPVSPTPTVTPTETPTSSVTPSETPTETPVSPTSQPTVTPTESPVPSQSISPTMTPEYTPTPTSSTENGHRYSKRLGFSFLHFPKGFPFTGFINATNFFNHKHYVQKSEEHIASPLKVCGIHDKN